MTDTAEIVKKLRLHFPLRLELRDPISGQPYIVERDNLMASLVLDAGNAVLESQTVAALYLELARAHASLKLEAAHAAANLKWWKASKRSECYRQAALAKDKPPSKERADDFYREDGEYMKMNGLADRAAVLADLLDDMKQAMSMKQYALRDVHAAVAGHNRQSNSTERSERLSEMAEELELQDRAAVEMDALLKGGAPPQPAEPEPDNDEDAEEDSEEEILIPPPPPAATKKSGKQPRKTNKSPSSRKGAHP